MSEPWEGDSPGGRLRSARWAGFGGTVIGEIARLAKSRGAVDLALGSPELPPPEAVLRAAAEAVLAGVNQYTSSWGDETLRQAIAAKVEQERGVRLDPAAEITVTCGATEGMLDVIMAVADAGDEVILFEPYYENYLQIAVATGMRPRFVRLHRPEWTFDERELAAAFSPRTKLVILNTPNNPTGKVLSAEELQIVAGLCRRWNVLCLSDEVYEHLVFDGGEHRSMIEIAGMRERTAVVNSLSKTYSVTGWRVGYVVAPPDLTAAIRTVHDVATYCAPAPLQAAAVTALRLPAAYYRDLRGTLERHRDHLRGSLESSGFRCHGAAGGYFMMTDLGGFGCETDHDLSQYLISRVGVAAV
ncbi:MAG: aminotransferase class I/II-fold pyridoxal phosphate-dependent enzyme, partial [Acidobacteriota bacterium]|nr:aminotransferase class I/II-fold pyridoxal phosphate-dependent enzyme [Acidobacteriota bacterium]